MTSDAPTLFPTAEPYRSDPTPRTTRVREHDRAVRPRARRSDPPTSVAAGSIDRGPLEARILATYEAHREGLTPFECAALLPDQQEDTVRTRVGQMRTRGVLEDAGSTRPSPRGRASMVLRIARAD